MTSQAGKSEAVRPEPETALDVTPLLLEVWRTNMRAKRDGASESVMLACERMLDTCRDLGIRYETYVGQPFDENLRVDVVEHTPADGPRKISACLTPGVFVNGTLVRKAQVTTSGEKSE
ncbi:hypothetical protein QPK87_31800 [Kamptonema cortianum]|nr:hypothetical protein [Kamptonema cortianum]